MDEDTPLPPAIEALDAYLLSDRSPPDCMDLSELDGFLAGVVAGPEVIAPSEWLPIVWDGDEPEFEDEAQASTILGAIMERYNAIATALAGDQESFVPLFWEAADGTPVVDEWAIGFMRAVSLRADAWDPVLKDEDSAILLIPIGIVAGQALGEEDPQLRIPEEAMDDLMEDGDMMMAACAVGLYNFWRDREAGAAAHLTH
ncbi:MAG: UPF0149 family protein [Acetobacteraceae bacterium]|nr:UPF0149 family protein [Acetobacteraceae bacterium]